MDCIIGTNGQEERVRTATKESGEAVSEGNVAGNMTVPRKDDGQIASTAKATPTIMMDCTATATLLRFTNHNNRKGVAERQL